MPYREIRYIPFLVMSANTTTPTKYTSNEPIRPGCYAIILATGQAGRISGKGFRTYEWGIDYSHDEYVKAPSWKTEGFEHNEIRRITPAQYHSLPSEMKIDGLGKDKGNLPATKY